ncbi:MAG: flagellar protein FliT [Halieaceae bacterium]|nr:flagellar protein FliT [Halieaceae bacterium]
MRQVDDLVERSGQCTLLANVLLMTRQMVELASAAEWDAVAQLESDRRELLTDTFSTPVPPEHSEIFAEALAAMLHMNEELMALLKTAKEDVTHQHVAQVRKREGIGHYLDVEGQR